MAVRRCGSLQLALRHALAGIGVLLSRGPFKDGSVPRNTTFTSASCHFRNDSLVFACSCTSSIGDDDYSEGSVNKITPLSLTESQWDMVYNAAGLTMRSTFAPSTLRIPFEVLLQVPSSISHSERMIDLYDVYTSSECLSPSIVENGCV